jgi:hypothetical protein
MRIQDDEHLRPAARLAPHVRSRTVQPPLTAGAGAGPLQSAVAVLQRQAGNGGVTSLLASEECEDPVVDRSTFIASYRTHLAEKAKAFPSSGPDRPAAAESLLGQVERVAVDLEANQFPDPLPEIGVGPPMCVAVPPDLIGDVRAIVTVAEAPGTGGLQELSPSGIDWNSRLGVPQYRTQSDNVAGPEVTCNVTSVAMALERVGVSRGDVVMALTRRIKIRTWRRNHAELKRGPTDKEIDTITLADDDWTREVRGYLDVVNADHRGNEVDVYKKVRGQDQPGTVLDAIASTYKTNAQMEDLLDLLNALTDDPAASLASSDAAAAATAAETKFKQAKEAFDLANAQWEAISVAAAKIAKPRNPTTVEADLLAQAKEAKQQRDDKAAAVKETASSAAVADRWKTTTAANLGVDIGTRETANPANVFGALTAAGVATPSRKVILNSPYKIPDPATKGSQLSMPAPPWADIKTEIGSTLSFGGAALLSLYHKATLATGKTFFAGAKSHIISVQQVTSSGIIVDDPYGRLDEKHRATREATAADKPRATLDAFSDPGVGRASRKNKWHGTQDWTVTAGETLGADEVRGQSHDLPDEMLASSWLRVTLYIRT